MKSPEEKKEEKKSPSPEEKKKSPSQEEKKKSPSPEEKMNSLKIKEIPSPVKKKENPSPEENKEKMKTVPPPIVPNIFFQNARISGKAPSPERLPVSQQLPKSIWFFVRVSSQDGQVSLVKPLPERIKKMMHHAKIEPGHRSAGPVFDLQFNGKHIIGLDAFRLDHSLQFVIEVPSCEAYSEQDPRVEPTSLTTSPYQPSSCHGEWNPRIIVPIWMGPARIPCGPSRLQLPLPPDSEDSEDSKEPIGNPLETYAAPPRSATPVTPATPVQHKQIQHKQNSSPPPASKKSLATSAHKKKEQEKAGASSSNASPSQGQLHTEPPERLAVISPLPIRGLDTSTPLDTPTSNPFSSRLFREGGDG